ncbi:MAG: hypothetical protein WD709_02410 [Gammaproteobacteria bacterium]
MEQIKALIDRLDALSIRERGLILAGILFILYSVWDSLLIQPQVIEERRIFADLQMKRAEQSVQNMRFQELVRQDRTDPDVANRARMAELKQQLAEIETSVRQSTNHLVSPANMAGILETILNKSRGLELTSIKGLGVSPLLTAGAEDSGNEDAAEPESDSVGVSMGGLENAYKHGLQISFEGDYMSTLAYLRELETLEWGFFWEKMEYEVLEYPRARATITLYTLSLEKEWIGV